ncbi:MAG TPA: hypothetical protein VGG33_23480, partial [Polyangia bacterium]
LHQALVRRQGGCRHQGRDQTRQESDVFQSGIHRADRSEAVETISLDNFIEADALADVMPVKSSKRH